MARPETIKTDLGQRIRTLRGNETRDAFCERNGFTKETFGNYERGDRVPDSEFLAQLREKTGVDLNWLTTGKRTKTPSDALIGIGPEFALLPRYDVEASAGAGMTALEELEIERIAFRMDWLREIGLDPKQAGLLTARGDSMSPTIPDGSLMLVDLRKGDQPRTGLIYVIVLDGELLVKRISRNVDKTIDLISDNPLYPVQKIAQVDFDKLFIAGRVFWFGRRI